MNRAVIAAAAGAVVTASIGAGCSSRQGPRPAAANASLTPSPQTSAAPVVGRPSGGAVASPRTTALPRRTSSRRASAKPSSSASPAAVALPVRNAPWRAMSYRTMCFGAERTVSFENGTATVGGATLRIGGPTYGDLTGDHVDDAVVTLTCSRPAAEPVDEAWAFTGGVAGPRLLGAVLAIADPQRMQRVLVLGHRKMLVAGLARSDGNAPPAPPDELVSTTWRYDGAKLSQVSRYVDPAGVLDPEG